jgi:hypothetical protein
MYRILNIGHPLRFARRARTRTIRTVWRRICWTFDQQKTPRDLKAFAPTERLAEKRHTASFERQRSKVPGRRVPSRRQWRMIPTLLRRTKPMASTPILLAMKNREPWA